MTLSKLELTLSSGANKQAKPGFAGIWAHRIRLFKRMIERDLIADRDMWAIAMAIARRPDIAFTEKKFRKRFF